jgi:hypothetical protein
MAACYAKSDVQVVEEKGRTFSNVMPSLPVFDIYVMAHNVHTVFVSTTPAANFNSTCSEVELAGEASKPEGCIATSKQVLVPSSNSRSKACMMALFHPYRLRARPCQFVHLLTWTQSIRT